MIDVQIINDSLASDILNEHCDDPLFSCISSVEAKSLIVDSFYGVASGEEMSIVDETLFGQNHLMSDYFAKAKPEDISIPVLLLDGFVHYNFKSDAAMNPPPLTARVDAPLVSYFVPFAFDAPVVYPTISASPSAKAVFFNPTIFKEVTYRNPQMFDVILRDRERLFSVLTKWLPINAITSTGYRIARLLMAHLPETCKAQETIPLTQAEIAEALACSRATITKGIASLHNEKIISPGYKEITVDVKKLKSYIRGS